MNIINLYGFVGKKPELKEFSQSKVANFTVATNKRRKNKHTGEYEDNVQWHNCTAWNNTADAIMKYVDKGKKVLVTGELIYDQWEDKATGKMRSSPKILVNQIEWETHNKSTGNASQARPNASTYQNDFVDDALPF